MKYSFRFNDRTDANAVDLNTLVEAKVMALQCLLDVARDEARAVPFQLGLNIKNEEGAVLLRLSLRVDMV